MGSSPVGLILFYNFYYRNTYIYSEYGGVAKWPKAPEPRTPLHGSHFDDAVVTDTSSWTVNPARNASQVRILSSPTMSYYDALSY